MLIRSIGLFWKRDDVFWNSAAKNGRLLGVPQGGKLSGPINFCSQTGIYILYADYDLIYVGQTGTDSYGLYKRLKRHTRNDLADRWNRFSWFGIRKVNNNGNLAAIPLKIRPTYNEAIDHIEAILIHAAEPPLNRQSGHFGESVVRYHQFRDNEKLGKTSDEILKDLSAIRTKL